MESKQITELPQHVQFAGVSVLDKTYGGWGVGGGTVLPGEWQCRSPAIMALNTDQGEEQLLTSTCRLLALPRRNSNYQTTHRQNVVNIYR